MKEKYVLFFLVISIVGFSCTNEPTADWKVKIENKTRDNIVCVLGYNYPDLSLSFIDKKAILAKGEQFEIAGLQTKIIDTLGLCKKEVWDNTIKHNMLMLMVFDKSKLVNKEKIEDALTGRYYFSYGQVIKNNGVITLQ